VRRVLRAIGYGAAGTAMLVLLLGAAAPLLIRGPRLGRLIERNLPKMCGEIRVGGGSWTWGAVIALLRGRPAPFELLDVEMKDPDGTPVLRARRLTGKLEVDRDRPSVVVHELRASGAFWRFGRRDPALRGRAGGNTGSTRSIGFLAAFDDRCRAPVARPAAPPGQPSQPARAPSFSLRIAGAELDGVEAVFAFPEWALELRDVHAVGDLEFRQSASARSPEFTFEVRAADAAGGGRLGVLPGAQRLELPFSRARIDRVATTAEAPDAIALAASDIVTGRSRSWARGVFTGVYGRRSAPGAKPAPAGIDLRAEITDAADAVQAVAMRRGAGAGLSLGGTAPRVTLAFAGPFSALQIDAEARGFDGRYREIEVRDAGLTVSAALGARRLRIPELTIGSPAGGRLRLVGEASLPEASVTLTFDRFGADPLLPRLARPFVGGVWDGTLRARLDLLTAGVSLEAAALTVTRPPEAFGPRVVEVRAGDRGRRGRADLRLGLSQARFDGSALHLRQVAVRRWGGRVTVDGRVSFRDPDRAGWLRPPIVDLSLRVDGISVDELVRTRFVGGRISGRARARGPLDDMALDLGFPGGGALDVLGEPFRLPSAVTVRLVEYELNVPEILLRSARGSEIAVAGEVGLAGKTDLTLAVRAFPLSRLPGLVETELPITGGLSGQLRLAGGQPAPVISGQLSVDEVRWRGRPLGGGSMVIVPAPRGGIRGRGRLIDGVAVDGTLIREPAGLRGELGVDLDRVRLDPFLADLPGGVAGVGALSGSGRMWVAPGQRAGVEGRITALGVTLTGPPARPVARGSATGAGRIATTATAATGATNTPTATPAATTRVTGARAGGAAVAGAARAGVAPGAARAGVAPGAARAAAPVRSVEIAAAAEIPFSARAGAGPVRVGPARLVVGGESIEIGGEGGGGRATATVRGRLDLGALAPLAGPWLQASSGTLALDVTAAGVLPGNGSGAREAAPSLKGAISVVAPLSLRPAGAPIALRIPSGRILLDGDRAATSDLPVVLGAGTLRVNGSMTAAAAGPPRLALDLAGELDARLLEALAPTQIDRAQGRIRAAGRASGPVDRPSLHARLDLGGGGVSFAVAGMEAGQRVQIPAGRIDLDEARATLRSVEIRVGESRAVIGREPGPPGVVEMRPAAGGGGTSAAAAKPAAPGPAWPDRVDLPVAGTLRGIVTRVITVDDARGALRLEGQPRHRLRLSGDVEIGAVRVRPKAARASGGSALRSSSLLSRPEIGRTELDLRVRSRGGAVVVELPRMPDLRVDVDYQVRGTVKRPVPSGRMSGADLYSAAALLLGRLVQ
jgi:hypothetical protein